jgi:Transposase DDE domain
MSGRDEAAGDQASSWGAVGVHSGALAPASERPLPPGRSPTSLDASFTALAASLRAELPGYSDDVAIDASDLPAYANGQRFLSKNGPERAWYSDPDASRGHRSAISTRKGGGFYGYRLHAAVCAVTGLPLAWRVASAREHESLSVPALLDTISGRAFTPKTAALDMGYDVNPVYDACRARRILPTFPFARRRL